jgi:hypothetical protein
MSYFVAITLPSSLDAERMKSVMIIAGIAFAAFGLLGLWVAKKIITKLLTLVVFGGVAIFAFTQRASLTDCLDKVRADVGKTATTCSVAGFDVKIPTDKVKVPQLPGSSTTVPTTVAAG